MKVQSSVNAPDELDPLPYKAKKGLAGWELEASDETPVVMFKDTARFLANAANNHAKLIRAIEVLLADQTTETAATGFARDVLKEVNSL